MMIGVVLVFITFTRPHLLIKLKKKKHDAAWFKLHHQILQNLSDLTSKLTTFFVL